MKKCKGITLIALIITIIILLILVGVSINFAIKGDLFGSAQKAVDGTNAKVGQEQSRVDELMGELDRVQVHNWVKSGDNVSCDHCGLYLKIGQEIKHKDTGADTATITTEKTGYSEDQTIEKGTDVQWVVFGVEDTNKDGINESLLLTTVEPTTTGVIWSDSILEYNNGETELNRICRELYGSDARSITMDDINSTLGYRPEGAIYKKAVEVTGKLENNGKIKKVMQIRHSSEIKNCTTGNFTTKLKELEVWDKIKNCTVGTNGDTAEKYAEYTYNGYFYSVDANGNIIEPINSNSVGSVSSVMRDMILGTENNYIYYIASKMLTIGCDTSYLMQDNGSSIIGTAMRSVNDNSEPTYGLGIGIATVFGGKIGREKIVSNVLSILSKFENKNATYTIRPTTLFEINANKSVQQMAVSIGGENIQPIKNRVRPIVTLTDKIPEQGNVITIYENATDTAENTQIVESM